LEDVYCKKRVIEQAFSFMKEEMYYMYHHPGLERLRARSEIPPGCTSAFLPIV
jgi:hypothetical protein